MNTKLLIALGFFVLAGCAASLPPLSPNQVSWASQHWAGADAATLESDRQLYVARCSRCHSPVSPTKLTPAQWPKWLDKMAPKARLTPEERENIWRYIQAASAAR